MPITVETKLFKFEELSQEAQQKAIETHRESLDVDVSWMVGDFEEGVGTWAEHLEHRNLFDVKEVWYSLGYCQGDGACFDGTTQTSEALLGFLADLSEPFKKALERPKFKAWMLAYDYPLFQTRVNNHHYYHEKTRGWHVHEGTPIEMFQALDSDFILKAEKALDKAYQSLCIDLKNVLYADMEHQLSDEAVKERLFDFDDYLYLEDGTLA